MWKFPGLLLEVWLCPDQNNPGEYLPACHYFGPQGDAARALNEPGSFCVLVFRAESHLDGMTYYHRLVDSDTYTTTNESDRQPYPVAWI
jgi:hypothetical protein